MNLAFAPKAFVRPKNPRVHILLTAENVAKATRGARERAYLAASWVLGSLTIIDPTVRLAARTFGVSVPTVRTAIADLKATTSNSEPTRIDQIWSSMSPIERSGFARRHLDELWAIFDHATA